MHRAGNQGVLSFFPIADILHILLKEDSEDQQVSLLQVSLLHASDLLNFPKTIM